MASAHLHQSKSDGAKQRTGTHSLTDSVTTPTSIKVLQSLGAAAVTLFALWFLFGIPAYLLFGKFFD